MMSARLLRSALALGALPLALHAQDNDPPSRAGRVSSVAGTVAFQAAGTPDWSSAPLNYTVTSGDRIVTSVRSRAEIEVGPFDVRLADSTDVSVVHLTDDFSQLGLNRGTMRVTVYRLASRDSMEVDTPNGAIIIRSAGKYRIDVLEGVSTIVSVEDGVAELSGPGLDYTLKRGQTVELTGTAAINAVMIAQPRNTDFDQWSAERDRRQESAISTRYVSNDIPGVADLDHHGHWEHHATYGYVWRPRIVQVNWVPYRYGRWVWSGPWGWTWVEDSPWGFAPFHYGRWVVIGNSWVWAPGPIVRRPYYAPALVVFVGVPRGRYHQAWFPLGWHEPYYPRYRHSDRYLREVNISHVRGITNVSEFVDPRRADRINYSNRQATTVVDADGFGRGRVAQHVVNVRADEIASAPIVRDRWEAPRIAARDASQPLIEDRRAIVPTPDDLRPRREAIAPAGTREPTRTAEPRMAEPRGADPRPTATPARTPDAERPTAGEPRTRTPLIFRNSPPSADRPRTANTPDAASRPAGEFRSRQTIQPAGAVATPIDRGPTLIRRNDPSARVAQPTRATEAQPRTSSPSGGVIGRSPTRTIERAGSAPDQSAEPRVSSAPGRVSQPRSSSPPARASAPPSTSPPTRSSSPPPAARPASAGGSVATSSPPRVSSRRPPR